MKPVISHFTHINRAQKLFRLSVPYVFQLKISFECLSFMSLCLKKRPLDWLTISSVGSSRQITTIAIHGNTDKRLSLVAFQMNSIISNASRVHSHQRGTLFCTMLFFSILPVCVLCVRYQPIRGGTASRVKMTKGQRKLDDSRLRSEQYKRLSYRILIVCHERWNVSFLRWISMTRLASIGWISWSWLRFWSLRKTTLVYDLKPCTQRRRK